MRIDEQDVHAMLAEGSLGQFLRTLRDQAMAEAAERRSLVLGFPDLAEALTRVPFGPPQPQMWNGSLPPESWREAVNASPRRASLVAIVQEAERRTAETVAAAVAAADERAARLDRLRAAWAEDEKRQEGP